MIASIAIGGAIYIQPPYQTLSLVLEYTPPVTAPALQVKLVNNGPVLRLEWMSRVDCFDLLQSRNQLQTNGWTEVEKLSGTGETLSKDIPASGAAGFYRLQRELR
jgi:hypothetical protein